MERNEKHTMEKIKYVPDNAINLIENDLLGTSVYVEVLEKIINDCPSPYTIGLFGPWGAGKSSIILSLKHKIKDKKIFIYDAWKYSKDDFRRTFLLELAKFTNNEKIVKELKNSLYVSKTINRKFGISKILNIEYFVTKNLSKITEPEIFEEKFKEIINSIKDKNKIIITIDNIDRCHKEQVLEILLTIKNFLEKQNVVFIIPLDDSGLRNYLQMSHQDASEFIRKIFNSTIHIKSFSDVELYEFGINLCNKYNIDIPKKEIVISIVTQEFTKNPRKIIQFLNILQTELYLVKLQEEKGLIPKGSITSNIEMLTKILILRDEYPELYQKIIDNKSILQEINQSIINNEFKLNENGIYVKDKIHLTLFEYRFLSRTSHISIDNNLLELFFVVKDVFKDIPDDIYQDIISQNWEKLKEVISKNNIPIQKLIDYIDTLINEQVIKKGLYETTGFNLISLVFKIIAERNSEIILLPKNIISTLNNINILSNFNAFPPREFVISIKWLCENHNQQLDKNIIDKIHKNIIELIRNSRFIDENLINLIYHFILEFDDTSISEIKDIFSKLLINNFTLYNNKFKDVINSQKVKFLLDDEFVNNLISQLVANYNQNYTKEKVELIKILDNHNILTEKTKETYLYKCLVYVGILQNHNNPEWFSFWVDTFLDSLIGNNSNGIIIKNFRNHIDNIIYNNYHFIVQQFNNRNFQPIYLKIYKSLLNLMMQSYLIANETNDQGKINELINWFISFYNYHHNQEITKHINTIYVDIVKKTKRGDFLPNLLYYLITEKDIEIKSEIFNVINLILAENIDLSPYKNIIKNLISNIFSSNYQQKLPEWLGVLINNPIFTDEIVYYINTIKDSNILVNIIQQLIDADIIKNQNFKEKLFGKIRVYLASNDIIAQQKGIETLHKLLIKDKNLLEYKKDVFKSLLNDINDNSFDENSKNLLNELIELYNN